MADQPVPAADPRGNPVEEQGPPTKAQLRFYRAVTAVIVGFCRLFWRMEVHGLDKVPDGPFVLSAVHRSNVDSLLVAAVTRRRMRFMGKHTMWKYDLPGRFFDAMGGIPVRRGSADREAMRSAVTALGYGEPVVMFPEGQRRTGPIVEDLFEGPAFVAGRTGVPIVPVGIGGSEAAMPPGAKWIKPVKVVLVIGDPIPAPAGEDGKRPSRRQVRETTELLQTRIQALFDDAQRRVGRLDR
ncbi:1-acyl-sn-glycerol-3-phosphate acyltransferase [Acidimicrobiia bacterium EGI L10123]|uniref:lysophospholipid acyltransferase family protein n=1 Tax=Salinilacustrithrix flava TaxID=2957203 RepID=UPI003D7C2BEA|nr:1-acyl-sn-glycerol-3-phosphate acyltransferase [Acidimicrobiia bacterium EGI L10123]